MCDFVIKAWKEGVSKEVVVKSFVTCGIAQNSSPEQISCLKEGKPAHEALPLVTERWNKTDEPEVELTAEDLEEDDIDTDKAFD